MDFDFVENERPQAPLIPISAWWAEARSRFSHRSSAVKDPVSPKDPSPP